jgi:hypothetical protein
MCFDITLAVPRVGDAQFISHDPQSLVGHRGDMAPSTLCLAPETLELKCAGFQEAAPERCEEVKFQGLTTVLAPAVPCRFFLAPAAGGGEGNVAPFWMIQKTTDETKVNMVPMKIVFQAIVGSDIIVPVVGNHKALTDRIECKDDFINVAIYVLVNSKPLRRGTVLYRYGAAPAKGPSKAPAPVRVADVAKRQRL